MIKSKLYEALVNNYYPANANTRVSPGGPKGPDNNLTKILIFLLILLIGIISYNFYFIS